MPIPVTCPGCHTRFRVSDQFAGRTGPCPKCKKPIRVPDKSDEVVIHAPEEFGPKNAEGRAVLKPIERTETSISAVGIVGIVGGVILVIAVAFLLGPMVRGDDADVANRYLVLGVGALLVAPPLVLAGYSFLRDADLEPYAGKSLAVRVTICSLVYALLWGFYAYAGSMVLGDQSPEVWQLAFALPAFVCTGALAPFAGLDLDYMNACFHYGFYLLVTVLLRVIMGIGPI